MSARARLLLASFTASYTERGRTLATNPAAVVFIVGDRRIALSEASAQYALYNMIVYAQARGIGSCLRGAGQIFLPRQVDLAGHGLVKGSIELWARHLFETVQLDGQQGFSRFNLWWKQKGRIDKNRNLWYHIDVSKCI